MKIAEKINKYKEENGKLIKNNKIYNENRVKYINRVNQLEEFSGVILKECKCLKSKTILELSKNIIKSYSPTIDENKNLLLEEKSEIENTLNEDNYQSI